LKHVHYFRHVSLAAKKFKQK